MGQREDIKNLLVQRLSEFDPALDVSTGSSAYRQLVEPILERLSTGPLGVDTADFIRSRLESEFPLLSVGEVGALHDMLVAPLVVLFAPLQQEIEGVKRGLSALNADAMTESEAEALASNFFITRRSGTRATVLVRLFYRAPTFVSINPTVEFVFPGGLLFFPTSSTVVTAQQMVGQRVGDRYFAEILAVAERAGTEYRVGQDSILDVRGLSGFESVTNLPAEQGLPAESAAELLARVPDALSERTLTVRRGIISRINEEIPALLDSFVVGFGDPEMQRDILRGGGEGSLLASGFGAIVGRHCLFFSLYEDKIGDRSQFSEGTTVSVNLWKFLYSVPENLRRQDFTVEEVLFESSASAPELPTVALLRLSGTPQGVPTSGSLPGVMPGVFLSLRGVTGIRISDIPGGIQTPDRETLWVGDGEVHVGGHYDVWVRGASVEEDEAQIPPLRSLSSYEGSDLTTSGDSRFFQNLVHRRIRVLVTGSTFQVGEEIRGATSGAVAEIASITAHTGSQRWLELWNCNGARFAHGEVVTGSVSLLDLVVVDSEYPDWPGSVGIGDVLSIQGLERSTPYLVIKVDGPFLYVNSPLSATERGLLFSLASDTVFDAFEPARTLVPVGGVPADDLRTTIGSDIVRTDLDLIAAGVEAGDTLEILDGPDAGPYIISGFQSGWGGKRPILSAPMLSSRSSLPFRVVRPGDSVNRPLVRVSPGGMEVLDNGGQPTGVIIPPKNPVAVYPTGAFSGARILAEGQNGFVLPDPGPTWSPSTDYIVDISAKNWSLEVGDTFQEFFTSGGFTRCFTDGCTPLEGYIAVVSIYEDGTTFVESELPATFKDFVSNMHGWLLSIIADFDLGPDLEALVDAVSLVSFQDPPASGTPALLKQMEICIPAEMFDGCENTFVALPEFDWDSAFSDAGSFTDALQKFRDGTLAHSPPALSNARPGSVLTVSSGPNSGSYIVHKVTTYKWVGPAHIGPGVDMSGAYTVAVAVIKDSFPSAPVQGLADLVASGMSWSLPAAPSLPFTVLDSASNPTTGWDWLEGLLTWFFQWVSSMGFDLPSGVSLDPEETLRVIWKALFTSYQVSSSTCEQTLRVYYAEPTTLEVYAPSVCDRQTWALPAHVPGTVEGEVITLPLPDLDGVEVQVELDGLASHTVLTAVLGTDAGAATTLGELAEALQSALDPLVRDIEVFSTVPSDSTGTLSIRQVRGGVDESLRVAASTLNDGLFMLGFWNDSPGQWASITSSLPGSPPYERITVPASAFLGFQFSLTLSDLQLLACVPSATAPIQPGNTISNGTSTAQVFAVAHDSTGTEEDLVWVTGITGPFSASDVITDTTTSASRTVVSVDTAPALSSLVTDGEDDYTKSFEDVASSLEAAFETAIQEIVTEAVPGAFTDILLSPSLVLSIEWVEFLPGDGRFEIRVSDPQHPLAVEGWEVASAVGTPYTVVPFVDQYLAHLSSSPKASSSGEVLGDSYVPSTDALMIEVGGFSGPIGEVDPSWNYWEAKAVYGLLEPLLGSDIDAACAVLNSDARFYADATGVRVVQWVSSGSELELRALTGGPAGTLTVQNTGLVGIADDAVTGSAGSGNNSVTGTSTPGTLTDEVIRHDSTTRFIGVSGQDTVQFVPSWDALSSRVWPEPEAPSRGVRAGALYTAQNAQEFAFPGDGSSPSLGGVRPGDELCVNEQVVLLEPSMTVAPSSRREDVLVGVATSFRGTTVRLLEVPSPSVQFYSGTAGNPQVHVGDYVFVEEGPSAGEYRVVSVTPDTLVLDRPLASQTLRAITRGNDLSLEMSSSCEVSVSSAPFVQEDVGRYLTIYSSSQAGVEGSYEITSVSSDGTTLTLASGPWDEPEQDLHWAATEAPVDPPASSATGGRTALLAVVPIRVYSGEPERRTIVDVSPHLAREFGRVVTSMGSGAVEPGVAARFEVVRKNALYVPVTEMSAHKEDGLFFVDIPCRSMGPGNIHNISQDDRLDAVVGTFQSDGYYVDVPDSTLSWSASEDAFFVVSPSVLPSGETNRMDKRVSTSEVGLIIRYEFSPAAGEVQRLLSSLSDRVVCSNALARHFLPSYVSLSIDYSDGVAPSAVYSALRAYINRLPPEASLDVSEVAAVAARVGVRTYEAPLHIWTLTHDLARGMTAVRSSTRIDDESQVFYGSNRLTYFETGPLREEEDDVSPTSVGARVVLVQDGD